MPKKTNDSNSATLLPVDWYPSPTLLAWAQAERPELWAYHTRIIDDFKDYWHSEPESKAKKRNWDLTFKRWWRNTTLKPYWKYQPVPPTHDEVNL